LVGYCEDIKVTDENGDVIETRKYPLDVYYIHAPRCWSGWHTQCENPPETLELRDAWMALEAMVGVDHSARRIGLSNVSPDELLDIIHFVQERQKDPDSYPPPRVPDAVQAMADPIYPSEDLRAVCRQYGIEFVSYSTLGTQHHSSQVNPVLTSPIVLGLAAKHQRSVAEVVLSWALQHGMSVIPRSNKQQHIYELSRLLEDPAFLDDDDLVQIDSMKQRSTY
jgi:glycerol 2-dehydrogenase (NADP+)